MKGKRIVLGLTGPTGCGKTQASLFLQSHGFMVINADEIVKDLYLNCDDLIKKIASVFEDAVENNNIINKKKLAKMVFANSNKLMLLEKIVWPFVLDSIGLQIERNLDFNLVIDAPTLFESGAFKFCNCSLALLSERSRRIARIIDRDGLTFDEAISRINSQKADSFYINKADALILNDGLKVDLFKGLQFFLKNLRNY